MNNLVTKYFFLPLSRITSIFNEFIIKQHMIHRCLTLAIIFLANFAIGHSQILIGKLEKPVVGALLELDNSTTITGTNSTKGMLMPRVALTSKTDLFPMFTKHATVTGEYSEGTKATEDKKHSGLVVYNTTDNADFSPSLYVWLGTEWLKLLED